MRSVAREGRTERGYSSDRGVARRKAFKLVRGGSEGSSPVADAWIEQQRRMAVRKTPKVVRFGPTQEIPASFGPPGPLATLARGASAGSSAEGDPRVAIPLELLRAKHDAASDRPARVDRLDVPKGVSTRKLRKRRLLNDLLDLLVDKMED